MATNIPPHNLGELVDALCALIYNPEATVSTVISLEGDVHTKKVFINALWSKNLFGSF